MRERCDQDDDAACPGACRPDCSCGTASGQMNLAQLAVATASSVASGSAPGNAIDGVVDGLPGDAAREWISDGEGKGAWLRLTWPSPMTVDHVVLHDRPNAIDNVTDAALLVGDDAVPVGTGPLPPDGSPTAVMFGAKTITSLTLMILQATGGNAGLSEIEVVAAAKDPTGTATTTPPGQATTTTTIPAASGPAYYVSPSGDDGASGTSAGAAWKTFPRAIKALRPGDTLVVGDGKYTRGTTGLPVIDCSSGARNGTADAPITIRAANERQAWLASDGIGDGVSMSKCSYWNLLGLRVSSADNGGAKAWEGNVIHIVESSHVALRRALAVRPNRTCPNGTLPYCNAHAIAIEKSHDVLVEEAEVYDFHRHGIDVFASRFVTVRRCYLNPLDAAGAERTGLIFYGSSDSIAENNIGEGVRAFSVAGGTAYDGSPGGYRNKILGTVTLNAVYGSTIRSRKFSGPVLPTGHNLLRDDVFAGTENVGVFSRGAADTTVENVTVFGTKVADGIAADEDLTEPAPCNANPDGCSITIRNALSVGNKGKGASVATSAVPTWLVDSSNFYANAGGDFPTSETISDDTGKIRKSMSVAPGGMGLGGGKCLLWAPDGSNMKRAGRDGRDIGATVLYRYQDGVLTTQRLWDRSTGAFPCGTVVPGVNDLAGRACSSVHQRLNVNTNGCAFPASY